MYKILRMNTISEQKFIVVSFEIVLIIICAFSVFYRLYYIPLLVVALWLFLVLNLKKKELLFIATALLPFSPGKVANVVGLTFIEMLAPAMLLILIYTYLKKPFNIPNIGKKFVFAISILILWSTFHFIKNPVSAADLFGVREEMGGLRSYYSIFVGAVIFFISMKYFAYANINTDRFLKFIFITALSIGYLRVLSYFFSFSMPLLGGTFQYAVAQTTFGEGLTHRIGGIDDCLLIGLPSLYGYYYRKKLNTLFVILFLFFFALAVIGGGRTIFMGIIILTIGYFVFIKKYILLYVWIPFFIFTLIFLSYFSSISFPNQFDRLLAFNAIENLSGSDVGRAQTWSIFFRTFIKDPIWGKGIGFSEESIPMISDSNLYEFIKYNIVSGGHNGYLSILAIFGIGGAIFIGIMLFGTIYLCFRYFYIYYFNKYTNVVLFILFLSILSTILYSTGGTCYKEALLYLSAGSISGIYARNKITKELHK